MVKRNKGNWRFDEKTAKKFQEIARANIPNYEAVIERSVEIVSWEFPDKRAKIIDIGCALGHTMEKFRDSGYRNVWGVDNSDAMLAHCIVRENLIKSDTFPKDTGPFDAVLANWTLHFTPQKKRERYLRDIYASLRKNGLLIVSDKMASSETSQRGYIAFKRSMGLSEKAIAKKTAAVEDVLTPLPIQWYLETLKKIGFKQIEIIDARWRFNTILCRK